MENRAKNGTVIDFYIILGSKTTVECDCSHEIKRHLLLGRKAMTNLHRVLKRRAITADKSPFSQSYGFPHTPVRMLELDHKEGWALKNGCFQMVVLEKTLESPLYYKINPTNLKGNQPWIFIGRTVAEAEALIFWPPDVKNWVIGKDSDAGKDWGQEEKGAAEDEMVGWHHQLSGHEFEPALRDSEGQRSPRGLRVRHYLVTEPQQQESDNKQGLCEEL